METTTMELPDSPYLLRFEDRKQVRAAVIAKYVADAGYRGVVCFSCGNASQALKEAGLFTVEVSPNGALRPGRWWSPAEIHRTWPDLFDATSGHLPMPLMAELAEAYREHLGKLRLPGYLVPTGSGETIVCLKMAYPGINFTAIYNVGRGTEYEPQAPLNALVNVVAEHPLSFLGRLISKKGYWGR